MSKDILLPIIGIKQKHMHCGPACVEMILKFYGYDNIDQNTIGRDLRIKIKRGCYPSDVIRYLKRFNIETEKVKNIELISKISEGRPIVLGQKDHFMLLIGIEGDQYLYIDPYTGRRNKDKLEFFKKDTVDLILIKKVGIKSGRKI